MVELPLPVAVAVLSSSPSLRDRGGGRASASPSPSRQCYSAAAAAVQDPGTARATAGSLNPALGGGGSACSAVRRHLSTKVPTPISSQQPKQPPSQTVHEGMLGGINAHTTISSQQLKLPPSQTVREGMSSVSGEINAITNCNKDPLRSRCATMMRSARQPARRKRAAGGSSLARRKVSRAELLIRSKTSVERLFGRHRGQVLRFCFSLPFAALGLCALACYLFTRLWIRIISYIGLEPRVRNLRKKLRQAVSN